MSEALLQIFAKAPVVGSVKTRLIVDIGEQAACEVYVELLEKTLQLAVNHSMITQLYCANDEQHPFFQDCIKRYNLVLRIQQGDDLGERMLHALKQGLKTYDKVVLIGADCPVLTESYINKSLAGLDASDVVLGPAEDGGFVLIACRNTHRHMFDGVSWGDDCVLQRTVDALGVVGLSYQLLPELWDIDRVADLMRWNAMSY